MAFGLGGIPTTDGSVVEAGYNHVVDGSYQSHYFTVSTMETITDFEHPVAGNRRWGIFSDPDHLGEFDFYTMGVDRIWDQAFSFGDWVKERATKKSGFDDADKLWSSLQSKMIKFISDNGGSASFYSTPKIVARPKWNDVEDYLKGCIDFPALKLKLGC